MIHEQSYRILQKHSFFPLITLTSMFFLFSFSSSRSASPPPTSSPLSDHSSPLTFATLNQLSLFSVHGVSNPHRSSLFKLNKITLYNFRILNIHSHTYFLYQNQTKMNNVFKWLLNSHEKQCSEHKNNSVTKVCCSNYCKLERFMCDSQQCLKNHHGHQIIQYRYYKQLHKRAQNQIHYRQQIQQTIRQYYESYIKYLQDLFNKETQKFLQIIDKKFFSKQFIEVYQRYEKKKDYIPFLQNLQTNVGLQLNDKIQKKILQKQKKLPHLFKQFISAQKILLDQSIFPQSQKIQNMSLTKIDKLKSILPFKCELSLKFQASKNKFFTNNIYQLGIRGPIILLAQSYKNRTFGGYSPRMFPRQERYEEDIRCESFLFSLDQRVRLPLKQNYKKYAIKGGPNLWFGRGDLAISDQCHKGNISWAQIGRAYQAPAQSAGNESEWLGGAWYFRVVEYQIYEVDRDMQK